MDKGKSPAFQFYVQDWLSDINIAKMTAAQEGAYIRLLAYCWNEDGLPMDDEILAVLSRLGEGWFNGGSTVVLACFYQRGERWYNRRLDEEKKKQENWRNKSSEGGKKSAEARAKKAQSKGGSTVVQPKVNSSSSSSLLNTNVFNLVEGEKKDFFPEEVIRLSDLLFACIQRNNTGFKGDPRKWDEAIDKMIRIDKRDPEVIAKIIIYAQSDGFWKANILSGGKLREKYDQLYMKAQDGYSKQIIPTY